MQFQDSESRLRYLMTSVDFYYRAPYDHGSLHVLKIKFYALTLFSRTIDTHVYRRTNAHRTQLQLKNRATHLCKCNVVADLKTRLSPYMLPYRIWSFYVKKRINTGKHPILGSPGTPLSWDGRCG